MLKKWLQSDWYKMENPAMVEICAVGVDPLTTKLFNLNFSPT